MTNPRCRAAVAAAMTLCALGLLACAGARLGGREPVPGSGPRGKPMRTATETAVGMPPAAPALVYPVTARVNVSDSYFGTEVEDPYRWLENLDSPQVAQWVAAQNALSQPRLAALPAGTGWRRLPRHPAFHEILGRVGGARRVGRVLQPLSGPARRPRR